MATFRSTSRQFLEDFSVTTNKIWFKDTTQIKRLDHKTQDEFRITKFHVQVSFDSDCNNTNAKSKYFYLKFLKDELAKNTFRINFFGF